jgi:hypothetical protein
MATLILTAVGTAVGGPIGGALGAVIGQAADQTLFAPKARHGPRLGDLAVQTSTYGSQIPRLFGTMRVAGTVIWATDLVETRASGGGGKGRPRSVSYSYSANFAVALSARRIRAVHRIWADGKLLRGAAGDLKASARLRVHDGDEDQLPDPLIVSAEGAAAAPAFRGIAYAVFEELQLEDFGNRIPSLTFEIEADPAPVTVGAIAETLSDGSIAAGATPSVAGYAASGDSVRSALAALAEPAGLSLAEKDGILRLELPGEPAALLGAEEFAMSVETTRRASGTIPAAVSLAYYDSARDYQIGTQNAFRRGAGSGTEALAVPAVLAAAGAKTLAEARLDSLWARRKGARLRLAWRREALRPGMLVSLPGNLRPWKIDRWMLTAEAVELQLSGFAGGPAAAAAAAAGRSVPAADLVHGPTTVRLLDLPLPIGSDGSGLVVLAGGQEPGWRRAALLFSSDGGITWNEIGTTAEPAVLGRSATALRAGTSALIDTAASVDVVLLNDALPLESRSDAALAAGANLALIGSELIQYGTAVALGDGRYRLSRLLRGRRGTEWAVSLHAAGEDFALLSPPTMVALDLRAAATVATAIVLAVGIGDDPDAARAELQLTGESLRPPSPVHLGARLDADGALEVRWTRRSRVGWDWASGGETPLGEEREAYVVTVSGGGASRAFDLAEPMLVYSAGQRAADGVSFPVTVAVSQVGTFAASRPAVLALG